ncbi:histidinol-phosphate transaminase [uncultured Roseobacter sp.]|uniref:pyridoxal phosphate-dependent aminotransferase n=1 Tax=uncultured Roseobacter sp. TaxID=114847 RepID=UPI00261D4D38|nr:histidinol-phosphate transaminase [uncultured Roseobacter sp.]
MIRALPHIEAMAPYALADNDHGGPDKPVLMAQNESVRPPSPAAVEAAQRVLRSGALYPDPDWTDLRRALSDLHDIDAAGILCGNGSLDLIAALARAYAGPGRAVLAPAHAYPFFATAAKLAGARFDTAPEAPHGVCVTELLRAVRDDTQVVFVANPGNPTGTRIPTEALRELREGLRDDILLIIDEAYGEFANGPDKGCWNLTEAGDCVVLRTFSKAYGLAGYRAGWGLFPPGVAAEVRKVLNPNNLAAVSQAAAEAAVSDQAYMRETCALTARARDRWSGKLAGAGFDVVPGCTNFLVVRFGDAITAAEADAFLRSSGVFVRRQHGAGLPEALRWTLAADAEMARAFGALMSWKEQRDG